MAAALPAGADTPLVSSLALVNADTNEIIRQLSPEDTVNLAALPTRRLNIEAITDPSVDKVLFRLNGQQRYRQENARPFALAGDKAGDFRSWTPRIGELKIEATPYLGNRAQETYAVRIRVVDKPVERPRLIPGESPRARLADPEPSGPADLPDELPIGDESQEGESTCRGFVNHENAYLTVVCSHELADAAAGKVLRQLAGSEALVCEFLNTASPMITSCASSESVISALRNGGLVVAIERTDGTRSVYPVTIE